MCGQWKDFKAWPPLDFLKSPSSYSVYSILRRSLGRLATLKRSLRDQTYSTLKFMRSTCGKSIYGHLCTRSSNTRIKDHLWIHFCRIHQRWRRSFLLTCERVECKTAVIFANASDGQYSNERSGAGGRGWLCCFPVFIRDRVIATSVTSHSNEWALRVAYSDYAI